MTDKVQKIREVIEKRCEYWRKKEFNSHSTESEIRMSECQHLLLMLNSLQEEPVSEELEKAANEWNAKALDTPFYMALDDNGNPYEVRQDYTTHAESFKAGAEWQEKQDKETIELAEDHAMFAGMEKMREQMMAKAVEVEVKVDTGGYPYIPQMELYDYDKDIPLAKERDKYKVILIKED